MTADCADAMRSRARSLHLTAGGATEKNVVGRALCACSPLSRAPAINRRPRVSARWNVPSKAKDGEIQGCSRAITRAGWFRAGLYPDYYAGGLHLSWAVPRPSTRADCSRPSTSERTFRAVPESLWLLRWREHSAGLNPACIRLQADPASRLSQVRNIICRG